MCFNQIWGHLVTPLCIICRCSYQCSGVSGQKYYFVSMMPIGPYSFCYFFCYSIGCLRVGLKAFPSGAVSSFYKYSAWNFLTLFFASCRRSSWRRSRSCTSSRSRWTSNPGTSRGASPAPPKSSTSRKLFKNRKNGWVDLFILPATG